MAEIRLRIEAMAWGVNVGWHPKIFVSRVLKRDLHSCKFLGFMI